MKILGRVLIGALVLCVLGYAAAVGTLYVKQRDFQYALTGEVLLLEQTALARAKAISIPSGEGASLGGWYAPPQPGKPVILYYKGNSGSFAAEHERYETWEAEGYGFLAFDYRGFPGSPGSVSQDAILEDGLAAYDFLAQEAQPIVIWGRSLGTGPATYVASRREADALLLETPFLSAVTVAAERYPIFPVNWVMFDQFPSNEWIALVEEPVFVAHGTADQTIGVSNGERLYQLAPHKYNLWIEEGAGHGDLWARGIWSRAHKFFEEARAAPMRREDAVESGGP